MGKTLEQRLGEKGYKPMQNPGWSKQLYMGPGKRVVEIPKEAPVDYVVRLDTRDKVRIEDL